uniref:Putative rrna processing protein rrp5 n=1 Tax=Culex tarsalis TaxID=7177 RepID=A0A1Q3EWU9_CULTA
MVYVEPSFPRGRKIESAEDGKKPRKKFRKNTAYGASTKNEEKQQKPRQRERQQARLEQMEQEREELQTVQAAAPLQFKTAQEGMLVLGCVYKVQKLELLVSLPGRLFGRVPLTAISEAYGKRLEGVVDGKEQCPGLEELYTVGDLVYVKIKGKDRERWRFELSLDPKELHSELNHKHLVEGLVISATVEEEEDHGYQMNVGIRNVRAFLPAKNVRNNRMEVGANLYCAVEKVTVANGMATVILRAFKPNELRKLDVAAANIDSLMPGSVVTFTVESILPNGLQGTLFDDTVPAFVNENMLEKPLSKVANFELFKQVPARILYVMPMTKHVFMTLALGDCNRYSVADPLPVGTVLKDAKVIHKCSSGGVWFQLGKKYKALLPRYVLKSKYNANYDEQIVMAKYQLGSLHTVRVIRYEVFDRTMIVSDDDATVGSRFFSLTDLRVGEVYDCRVTKVLDNKLGLAVSLGKVKGIVMSHNYRFTKPYAPNQSIKLRLIGIDEDRQQALFTNHPEYLRKSAKLILDRATVKPDQKCLGTVISEQEKYFIVAFCNKITAILFKFCRSVTQDSDRIDRLKPGSVDTFTVHEVTADGAKITLALPIAAGGENLGHVSTATVTGIFATGVDVYLVKENETGTVPPEALSDFPTHNALLQSALREGDKLKVVNVQDGVFSCRDVAYFNNKPTRVEDVRVGQILRAYYVEPTPKQPGAARFRLALKDYPRRVVLKAADFGTEEESFSSALEPEQVVLVKVKRTDEEGGLPMLRVSPKLEDVCRKAGPDEALRYMQTYLDDVKQLVARFKSRDKPFAQYTIGQSVSCVVESFVDDGDQLVVRLGDSESEDPTAARGLARKDPKKDGGYTVGEQLSGRIVWVDVERQLVHVCITKKLLKHVIDAAEGDVSHNVDDRHSLVALFSNRYVAVGCVKKVDSPLVIVPVKTHYNDLDPAEVGAKATVVLVRNYEGFVCGLTEQTYERFRDLKPTGKKEAKEETSSGEVHETAEDNGHSDSGIDKDDESEESKVAEKTFKKSKKKAKNLAKTNAVESPAKALKQDKKKKKALAKKLKNGQPFVISQLDGTDDTVLKLAKKKQKKQRKEKSSFLGESPAVESAGPKTKEHKEQGVKRKVEEKPVAKLPGAESFWSTGGTTNRKQQPQPPSDSSDDDEDQPAVPAKKGRLTAKERFEAMKQEEKRIRQIEEELADASVDPHTPDQFDRLLLSQPNSSLLWIRYMVFHMESAEIDKARAVARRALKTINFREENERLNVWIALLNLELRYETIDTFREILLEAVQYNDPYKVYSKVIEVLIDCGKTSEVLDMIELLQKRFRKQPEMWHLIATCYYKIGHRSKVKPLLAKALKSLENKEHIPLIVKFAFLHNRNDDRDEAHILFEQILTSYPKRTDIWSQYVDMLVKDGLVDVARQTLDRAIVQRLPMRNMKTLFTKYVNFEEKHGDRDAVRRIKQQAAEYVERQLAEGKSGARDE